jgi:hypothetical protein
VLIERVLLVVAAFAGRVAARLLRARISRPATPATG